MSTATDRIWKIPRQALSLSLAEMALDGARGDEGIAFWLGVCDGADARVTHVLGVRGPHIAKGPLFLRVGVEAFNAISDFALRANVVLLGQVHAHPGGFIDLSPTDRQYGIAFADYLSVVAPDYAQGNEMAIEDCGVHVYSVDSGYVRLAPDEVRRRVLVTNVSAELVLVETHR